MSEALLNKRGFAGHEEPFLVYEGGGSFRLGVDAKESVCFGEKNRDVNESQSAPGQNNSSQDKAAQTLHGKLARGRRG